MAWETISPEESDYYESLEDRAIVAEKDGYMKQYDGSYEVAKGDYEGAILARDEYNSGSIS